MHVDSRVWVDDKLVGAWRLYAVCSGRWGHLVHIDAAWSGSLQACVDLHGPAVAT